MVLGIAFFWWGLRFLIGGRVSYLAAMPGAAATLGLAGLRAFSGLVFEPLIVTNAVSYGALGTVLIVQSWLIGVGWVVFAGQLFGRWSYDAWLQARAQDRQGHREPGSGEEDEQRPGTQHAAWVGGSATIAQIKKAYLIRRALAMPQRCVDALSTLRDIRRCTHTHRAESVTAWCAPAVPYPCDANYHPCRDPHGYHAEPDPRKASVSPSDAMCLP